jgi:uncharacterized protein (DUF1330 family)
MAQPAPFALALLAMFALAAGARAQPAGASASTALAGPPAFLLAELTVTDPAGFARDYGAHVARIAAAHGGEFLARGGQAEALEGRPPRPRVVILRFPSMAAARAFWTSPDYKAIAPARQRTARTRAWLVEGLPPAPAASPAQPAPASDPAAPAAP